MLSKIIHRPIAVTMCLIAVVVMGCLALRFIPVSLMPDIDVPQITVQANIPGHSAKEIEQRVISPLRGQLMQVAGVKDIRSEARMDAGHVVMTFEPGSNVQKGQPVYTMAKTNPVWVRAYVNETNLGNIKYGQEVNVYTDTTNPNTGEKREYKGQIGYISPVAEFTPKTVQSTDTRSDLVYLTIKVDLISKDNQNNNADGNN